MRSSALGSNFLLYTGVTLGQARPNNCPQGCVLSGQLKQTRTQGPLGKPGWNDKAEGVLFSLSPIFALSIFPFFSLF